MSKNKGPFSMIKNLFQKNGEEKQKLEKKHYMMIILIVGISIMLFGNFMQKDKNQSSNPVAVTSNTNEDEEAEVFGSSKKSQPSTMRDYEEYYENQLKEAIESIVGVGDISIVVNVDSTEQVVYEKNIINKKQITSETDSNGGKREVEDNSKEEQIVVIREGDKEVPLVSETKKPVIRGVLVVAKGAENVQVKKAIIEAVMRTLDVPSHRVSVLAKK
ncbi:stage III sporulation protein AG [Bacillus andreraoultii]|uniref:stage III sporulation protein AG n=1 Tax=Bacillus andreraoultii TaxID=1499685 RepID=UPI00053AFCF5|nr:stage III sporulation protein AG [Bacillus andreraoultii]